MPITSRITHGFSITPRRETPPCASKVVTAIGHGRIRSPGGGSGEHAYDIHDFFEALDAGNLPAVSFLKAPAFQDGHPGYSNPIDEQTLCERRQCAAKARRMGEHGGNHRL